MNQVRPLFRSRLFWLGSIPFLFLVWVWSFSVYRKEFVEVDSRLLSGSFASQYGTLTVPSPIPVQGTGSTQGWFSHYGIWLNEVEKKEWFRRALVVESENIGTGKETPSIKIAWWFTTVIYAASWSGSCCWWQRRKRRIVLPRPN